MAYVERRGPGRWRARYRAPDGRERSRTFERKIEAEQWLAGIEVTKARGDWVDPARARVTVGEWGRAWLERKALRLKPSTLASYRSLLERCLLPDWDRVPLARVEHSDVDAWVARLSTQMGASRVRKAHYVFAALLDAAIRDGRLSRNPARGVDLPRLTRGEHRFLDHDQVRRLADAVEDYRALVLTLAYCGLRFGEAAALRVGNVDLMRGRIRVSASVTEVNGREEWGTPKTHASRDVPVPRFLRDALAEHMAGKGPDDLVFCSPEGTVLRNGNFRRRIWNRAVVQAGLPGITPHDLRHTAASLAIGAGANVKAVQRMLGHKSAAMTLDVYGGLFEESLDNLAASLDEAASAAGAASMRPGAPSKVVEFPAASQ